MPSETFYCPHCQNQLTKTAQQYVLGLNTYSIGLGQLPKYTVCPACGSEIDLPKMIKGEYDNKAGSKSGGCFIATACYGNYDAPEVLVLRQLRDDKLLTTFSGKIFVKFYYSVSPFFAVLISKSYILKKLVRQYFLKPVVTILQRQNK